MFPRTERVCRLARVAKLKWREASLRLAVLDATVDYDSLDPASVVDEELRRAYLSDTGESGVSEGASIILGCRLRSCFLCDAALPPAEDNEDRTETCCDAAKENNRRIITGDGPFSCYEFKRICGECDAVHYSSHVAQYGQASSVGGTKPVKFATAFDWKTVDVLRVHHNRWYTTRIVDLAIRNYIKAFTPFHTSSKMSVNASAALEVPLTGEGVKDKTFVRACIMRALVFWKQHIAMRIQDNALDNMKEVFDTEDVLDELLARETRHDGYENRGCIARWHTHFALKHTHGDSCYSDGKGPGDDGFCQDGNFDATYSFNKKQRRNPFTSTMRESATEDNSHAPDEFWTDGEGDGETESDDDASQPSSEDANEEDEEETAAQSVMEKTDRDEADEDLEDQLSHPYVRRIVMIPANMLADLKPGGVRIDAKKLATLLGYDDEKTSMMGIVARGIGAFMANEASQQRKTDAGLDFKKWTIVFPHKNYKSDEASALLSKEFHFGATKVRTFLGKEDAAVEDYVDWANLPSFMAVEGGDYVEYPDGTVPEPLKLTAESVEKAEERTIKRCFTAGTAMACLAKENANPQKKKKGGRSDHVEGICFGCGWHVMLTSFQRGEGSVSNGKQYCDLILDHEQLGLDMPIRWWQDNACNQVRHHLAELARWAMGLPCLNEHFNVKPWLLFMILSLDVVVDRYHFRVGHVERWCRCFLSPEVRSPPEGTNTQAAEQQWVPLVRLTRSLNYMKPGRFQFWALTYYMLTNVWRDATPAKEQQREDKKNSMVKRSIRWTEDGRPFHRMNKHRYRSHALALKQQKKKHGLNLKPPGKKPKENEPKRRRVTKGAQRKRATLQVKSRVPITKAMREALPYGCDKRLLEKVDGRYRLTHIPTGLFRANFDRGDNLKQMVLDALGTEGEATLEARFVVRARLHRWMVNKVDEAWKEKHTQCDLQHLNLPGGFAISGTACGRQRCTNSVCKLKREETPITKVG